MERLKEAAAILKLYPKLKLAERKVGANGKMSVHPTGPHKVKFIAEPVTTKMRKDSGIVKAFKFIVEENGVLLKWLIPVTNADGEGHYLIERLQDIKVGEEVVLEMKKSGMINYVDVRREGESDIVEDEEITPENKEDVEDILPDEEGIETV